MASGSSGTQLTNGSTGWHRRGSITGCHRILVSILRQVSAPILTKCSTMVRMLSNSRMILRPHRSRPDLTTKPTGTGYRLERIFSTSHSIQAPLNRWVNRRWKRSRWNNSVLSKMHSTHTTSLLFLNGRALKVEYGCRCFLHCTVNA
jgi:hypothetical protein